MIHFKFSEADQRYMFLTYDTELEYSILHNKLKEYFNLVAPECYLKNYKGPVYTHDFLFEYNKNGKTIFYCSIGLWQTVYLYFKKQGIEYDGLDPKWFKRELKHTFEEFKEIVDSWSMSRNPRPYQYDTAYKILTWKKSICEIATRGGKTLIAYMVFRYCMEYLNAHKILMVVPSVDLVKQGFSDFNEYAEFFNTECIWSGGKVVESSNLTIATFQSLVNFLDRKNKKYNPSFFDGYDIVFVDETHRAAAASIKNIISQPFMKDVKIAFGMTGTLPKENTTERYCVHALLGARIVSITPKDLMDEGYISQIKIYQHVIEYNDDKKQLDTWIRCAEYSLSIFDEVTDEKNPNKKRRVPLENPDFLIAFKKTFPEGLRQAKLNIYSRSDITENKKKLMYKDLLKKAVQSSSAANFHHIEQMMVHFFPERIEYLIGILANCPRNTLVLAQHVEYIKHVAERVKEAFPDRPVIAIYGGSKDRKKLKEILTNNNEVIVVGGYSIMSTGLTLPGLCYGVLFESFASNIVNTQSIGRGLALVEGKDKYILHDITDAFSPQYASKKIYLQGLARRKQYTANHYEYEVIHKYI
ncbi:MAG: DEAD/DEAH box helicase family protein [Clostridia bacterium]|nr:DEAD/DEAH box helicase family protein [Clostridia bacterium]